MSKSNLEVGTIVKHDYTDSFGKVVDFKKSIGGYNYHVEWDSGDTDWMKSDNIIPVSFKSFNDILGKIGSGTTINDTKKDLKETFLSIVDYARPPLNEDANQGGAIYNQAISDYQENMAEVIKEAYERY